MKFKFTKEWCEKAAKFEQGVGGLMACNPKYLKENQMSRNHGAPEDIPLREEDKPKSKKPKSTLTKEQKDFIQGKIRKVKGLAEVIKQQELFIEQVKLTHIFLLAYEGNPDSFKLLIGGDVWDHYRFEECYVANNPEYMWECIDEMTCDIVYKNKNFTVTGNGIFVSLHFSKKKNDKKFKDNFKYLLKYGEGGEWHI
jgi:hypothetical protein